MISRDPYDTLTERLGFPGSTRLRSILVTLMSAEQARMAEALPGSIGEVAEKTGLSEGEVSRALDELYVKGVVYPRGDFAKREYYRFARNIIQLHDAVQASRDLDPVRDRGLFQQWHEFCKEEMYPRMGAIFKAATARISRVVPAYKSVEGLSGVLPWEDYREIMKAQDVIAVVPCSCRIRTTAVNEHCEHTAEEKTWHCLQFGRGAEYVINRRSGRQLTAEQALLLVDDIEADGLVHRWANNTNMSGINTSCNCCRDCCEEWVSMDMAGVDVSHWWEKSRFEAYLASPQDCNGCFLCADRCQFDAIEMKDVDGNLQPVIDSEKCFGCGVCVVGCSLQALKMKAVRPPEHIPAS